MELPGSVLTDERTEKYSINISQNPEKKFYKNIYLRTGKPATKIINISSYAYKYFVSKECPEKFDPIEFNPSGKYRKKEYVWNSLTREERIKWHILDLCASMNARMLSYNVYE